MDTYVTEQCGITATDYRYDMSYYSNQEGVITGLGYQSNDWVHPSQGGPTATSMYKQNAPEHIESPYSPYLSYPSPQSSDSMQLSPPTYYHGGYATSMANITFPRADHLFTRALTCGPSIVQDRVPKQTTGPKSKRRRVQSTGQRRAANIRERRRMNHLNEAFDELRKRLPAFNYEKRLSRIETLRLAMTYISFMQGLSEGKDPSEVQLMEYRRSDDYDDLNNSD